MKTDTQMDDVPYSEDYRADGSAEALGKTAHQTLGTVDVAPMAEGEAEEGEPPYKAARSGDIVMVIDGETLCVPEEDVPKVY